MDARITDWHDGKYCIEERNRVVFTGTLAECEATLADAAAKDIEVADLDRYGKCRWLVHGTPRWVTEAWAADPEFEWYPEEPGDLISECGAEVTDLPNGWRCAAGHSHFADTEYYDDDEVQGLQNAHLPFAPNAARIDGSPI